MRLGSRSFLPTGRRKAVLGFGLAFVVGLAATLALGAGGMYAYDQQYAGRVLPGVRVGSVDLSGLDRDAAREQLLAAYASLEDGSLVLEGPDGDMSIPYSAFDRTLDVEPVLDAAMAVGRAASPVDRAVAQARTVIEGVTLEPTVRYDAGALNAALVADLTPLVVAPVDATLSGTDEGFSSTPARVGQTLSVAEVQASVEGRIGELELGPELRIKVASQPLEPRIDDTDAAAAIAAAERMVQDVEITIGDESWPIRARTIRTWIGFQATPEGTVAPTVDAEAASVTVRSIATKINREPKNATFLIGKSGAIVGVTASKDGRSVDQGATTAALMTLLEARGTGVAVAAMEPALTTLAPELNTEEAEKAAPRMVRISTWTTYYPISEKNGFAANITIPTSIIDGTVVAPGEWFDFWAAVGPVLQGWRRDPQRPHRADGRPRGRDLLVLDHAVQRRRPGRARDGEAREPLLLHRPLSAWPGRDRLEERGLNPVDELPQRHPVPDPDPRHQHPQRQQGLRALRPLQRAHRALGELQHPDRQGPQAGDHDHAADQRAQEGAAQADRVARGRPQRVGHADGPRRLRQRDPQRHVVLGLQADRRHHPGRDRRRDCQPHDDPTAVGDPRADTRTRADAGTRADSGAQPGTLAPRSLGRAGLESCQRRQRVRQGPGSRAGGSDTPASADRRVACRSAPRPARGSSGWERDRRGAAAALASFDATGVHGRVASAYRRTVRAGLAALDGNTPDALTGFRGALAEWRDLGCVWRLALTAIVMATVLEPDLPEVRSAADEARGILARLGARPFLERLDELMAHPSLETSQA
jgi:hypothetical protein